MAKKILLSEKIAEEGLEFLRGNGYEVDVKLDMATDELIQTIPEYDALIVRSVTKVTREVIEAGTRLRIIGRAGVTVDNIDIDAATDKGIIVCNAPTSNIISAAEHTMALMLACARHIPQANASMHEGKWDRNNFTGDELYDKTLAIFGLGRIGGLVAERAKAFGMNLIGYDPYCNRGHAEQLGVTLYDDFHELLPLADFITVHLPATKATIGMFGPDQFAMMKDGVVLINTACAGIYNLNSLADFLAAGKIGAVAIDMFSEEPCTYTPLHQFENAILTPRLGAATYEAQSRASKQIAEYVAAGLEGSIVPTALNMVSVEPEMIDAMGPYVPACQMMGSMLAQMGGGIPQRLEITASGTLWQADLTPLIASATKGILSYKRVASVTSDNAEAMARRHGITIQSKSIPEAGSYASTVSVVADGVEAACTLGGDAQTVHLVSLLGYKLDIVPAAQSLIFEYEDAPGRIGVIGTILGEQGINITTMQVAVGSDETCSLVYMNIEGEVSDDTLAKLHAGVPDLKNLWHIKL